MCSYKLFSHRLLFWGNLLFFMSSNVIANQIHDLHIGKFSQGDIKEWQVKSFEGDTEYKIVKDSRGNQVLMATSHNSASGLFNEQRIDLYKTPYLHWSWKTDNLYSIVDESHKQGDDFVARIYVIINGGLMFWNTKALNYVWSSSFEKGDTWLNPYTANAKMFAVEAGKTNLGHWVNYTRNVSDDLKKLFGTNIRYIDAVAIMTDSDNSGLQASTYYGDIYFSSTPLQIE